MIALSVGFINELEKIALPRYEREIAAGNVTRQSIDPSALPGELPGILNVPQRQLTRQNLAAHAPRSAESLAKTREMAGHLYTAQAKANDVLDQFMPGTGPGTNALTGQVASPRSAGRFVERFSEGPAGQLRAAYSTFGDTPGTHPKVKQLTDSLLGSAGPADKTITHAVMRHELGERAAANSGVVRPFASHLGVQPILEEQMASRADPLARQIMQKMRTNSDDALVQKAIRQVGGIADSPLALGGRQQRAVERILDRNVSKLSPQARINSIKFQGLLGHVGKPATIGYLPKGMEQPIDTATRLGPKVKQLVQSKRLSGLLSPAAKETGQSLMRLRRFIKHGT